MPLVKLSSFLFKFYRLVVSPLIHLLAGPGYGCRFEPCCSEYGEQSLRIHGFLKGSALTIRRVARCHPFSKMKGFDPVPNKKEVQR